MITNDPNLTRGMVMHLNDVYVFKPVFVDGELVCFAWPFIHFNDVGGAAPGSVDMFNTEIHQEGLRLRPALLYRAGVFNEALWNIFADNSRHPPERWHHPLRGPQAARGLAGQSGVPCGDRHAGGDVGP